MSLKDDFKVKFFLTPEKLIFNFGNGKRGELPLDEAGDQKKAEESKAKEEAVIDKGKN
jgi:hypothetical protein